MASSSSSGSLSKAPNLNPGASASNQAGAPLSTPGSTDLSGFAGPPPGFDPEQTGAAFLEGHGQGLLNPADGIEESVDAEIARKIDELEKARGGPATDNEKERIANRIRALREGGWLEGLKLQLAGKNSVPIEYFNRLVAEHENAIVKVARINARAERRIAKKDAQIEALVNGNGSGSNSGSGDGSTLLNNAILRDDNQKLMDDLAGCQQRGTEMQREIQRLKRELQQEKSKPHGNADVQDDLAKCNDRVKELQRQLDSAKRDLDTARGTASRYYNEIQSYRQQRIDLNQRERGNKDEIQRLREELKGLNDILAKNKEERSACNAKVESLEKEINKLKDAAAAQGGPNNSQDLRRRISELETERAKCKAEVERLKRENSKLQAEKSNCNARVESLEKENKKLKLAAALQEGPDDPEGLRKRILELQAQLMKRDATIKALEAELAKARDASLPEQDGNTPQEPRNALQARCTELRNARDMYRNKWARLLASTAATGSENLTQFWEAVENTDREIKDLYRGIERLGRVLGLTNVVFDTPQVLDKIISQVTGSVTNEKDTLQLAVVNLRNVNLLARVQIETLERQLDRAQLARSDDEVRVQLGAVNNDEVERRVSLRTQTYRDHRRSIISHIFNAQAEFLALAETSGDRDAIEGLVERFLQPTSLPMIQLAQNARQ
ncbi:hypothetical protein F4859DRAFT_522538 [Xylaria cf. heliscus]|nr:hypothetical protein F4859DRAFT_522538 [Xylaria cf. heliscus]